MRHPVTERDKLVDSVLAAGRGELAAGRFRRDAPSAETHRLLCLLWHERADVRRRAVSALAGGDAHRSYTPCYGHFVGTIERELRRRFAEMPPTPAARLQAVEILLQEMLEQSVEDIRGLSNMNYSFLSSALYLALFSTCRDVLDACYRLQTVSVQGVLCRLLVRLAHVGKTLRSRRLNGHDCEAMARMAGRVLAVLPADAIPDVWQALSERHVSRRRTVLPVLCVLENNDAVPHLLAALPNQPTDITLAIMDCLARIGDARALPALLDLGQHRNRNIRRRAQAALLDLEKAHRISPSRTLVRAVGEQGDPDPASLLRSLPQPGSVIPPEQLLRTAEGNPDDTNEFHS